MSRAAWLRSAPARWALFLVLVGWGLGYIGWFAHLIIQSRDFVATQRLQAVCAAPAATKTEYLFNDNAVDRNMLASGWGTPEDWGIWSSEQQSVLALPIPRSIDRTGARLSFEVMGPTNEKFPVLLVHLSLAGKSQETWLLRDGDNDDWQHIDVPANALAGRRCIELGIRYVRPYRPIKAQLGTDARLLGIGLKRVIWQNPPKGVR